MSYMQYECESICDTQAAGSKVSVNQIQKEARLKQDGSWEMIQTILAEGHFLPPFVVKAGNT